MDEISRHYKGKKTAQGHRLDVDEEGPGVISIGFTHTGEYQDEHGRMRISVARVSREGENFSVGWFHGTFEEPSDVNEFTSPEALFAALDEAIERRSAEVGPSEK